MSLIFQMRTSRDLLACGGDRVKLSILFPKSMLFPFISLLILTPREKLERNFGDRDQEIHKGSNLGMREHIESTKELSCLRKKTGSNLGSVRICCRLVMFYLKPGYINVELIQFGIFLQWSGHCCA